MRPIGATRPALPALQVAPLHDGGQVGVRPAIPACPEPAGEAPLVRLEWRQTPAVQGHGKVQPLLHAAGRCS